ncbi:putative pectinesterase [Prevotella sp. CAG:1124]|nr:putative pectinesterase [Prevotella sp. CAG:1124]
MIGDSTMANKDVSGGKLERGWGMMLKNFFTDNVIVNNHALNGRSSKSFIAEGHWQKVVEQIRPGDYVFIQFGHNDEKADTLRHTDPGTSFDDNLRRFVNETRLKGGIPVLFNSVVRRTFADSKTAVEDDDKRDNSSNYLAEGDTLVDTHGAYLLSPRNVAVELDVPFVDANKITHDLEEGLGPDGSKKLHMWYRPGEVEYLPDGRQDNTHYNVYGAYIVAGLLAEAVADEVPELKDYFRHYDMSVANDGSGLYFDLQSAIDAAEPGSSVTILVGEGEWVKPSIPKNKKIKFVLSAGAKWL